MRNLFLSVIVLLALNTSFATSEKILTDRIDVIARKDKLENKDLDKLVIALKSIHSLDQTDPSRSAAFDLAESYYKNKKLYDKALKKLNHDEQKTMSEIIKIWVRLHKEGNG